MQNIIWGLLYKNSLGGNITINAWKEGSVIDEKKTKKNIKKQE